MAGLRFRPAQLDVLGDRGVEHVSVLRGQPDRFAQLLLVQVTDVRAAKRYPSTVRIPEANEEFGKGALADPAGPDQGDRLAGPDFQIGVAQQQAVPSRVGETHAVQPDRAAGRHRSGMFRIEDGYRTLGHFLDAFGRFVGRVNHGRRLAERGDRLEGGHCQQSQGGQQHAVQLTRMDSRNRGGGDGNRGAYGQQGSETFRQTAAHRVPPLE